MEIKFKKRCNDLYIYLYGELDECSALKTRTQLDNLIDDNRFSSSVVFDLSGVTFMDSTGIGMFLGRYKKIKSLGMPVYISGASLNVEKILELSGIYSLMPRK